MFGFPRFHGFSFWVGFLLGLALGLAVRFFREWAQLARSRWQTRRAQRKAQSQASRWHRWRKKLHLYLQGQHVAGNLFPLEAVLLPPRVVPLPPFPLSEEEEEELGDDPRRSPLLTETLPPALEEGVWEALYFWPSLSLEEALSGGASLVLVGPLGSGKSTALAHLTLQRLARGSESFPLWMHAADLPWQEPELLADAEEPWKAALEALKAPLGVEKSADLRALEGLVQEALREGRTLILLDGADELPPWKRDQVWDWIRRMRQRYPHVRWVVAAGVDGFGDLVRQGFQPVRMLPWNPLWVQAFLRKWEKAWNRYVAPHLEQENPPRATYVFQHWLLTRHRAVFPLELTLQAWGLWAGDLQGPSFVAAVHAWARRLSQGKTLPWEELGRRWLAGEPVPSSLAASFPANTATPSPGWGLRLRHVVLAAYGAAYDRTESEWPRLLRTFSPYWELRTVALAFWGRIHPGDMARMVQEWMHQAGPPLYLGLWEGARALAWSGRPERHEPVLKALGWLLHQERLPVSVRLHAAWALWRLVGEGSKAGFRALLKRSDKSVRHAAALACGLAQDEEALPALLALTEEVSTLPAAVRRAVFLALALIGTEQAVRGLGAVLLGTDDDDIRRDVAEALARSPRLGRAALEEAAQDADLLVRKAAVYGLAQIPAPWARELLERISKEDKEWLVRNAAQQALEALRRPSPWVPRPVPGLHEEPWLVAFAQARGLTLAPGKAAWVVFSQALHKGDPEVRRRALRRLLYHPNAKWVQPLMAFLPQPFPIGDEAWNTLRHYAWAGIPVKKG